MLSPLQQGLFDTHFLLVGQNNGEYSCGPYSTGGAQRESTIATCRRARWMARCDFACRSAAYPHLLSCDRRTMARLAASRHQRRLDIIARNPAAPALQHLVGRVAPADAKGNRCGDRDGRSEERRVGKEGRARGARAPERK